MTSRVPGGCLCVVSTLHWPLHHAAPSRGAVIRILGPAKFGPAKFVPFQPRRHQSSTPAPRYSIEYSPRLALNLVESRAEIEPLNPPRSVLPPLLQLPVRSSDENQFTYLFRLGKAYASFYKDGVKAVWFNHKATNLLKKRITEDFSGKDEIQVMAQGLITRAEAQLLRRDRVDMAKLPVFALLVLIFGEWLPLLVPWMPSRVPGTCRIPRQVHGMRFSAQQRRNQSFRSGVAEPSAEQLADVIKASEDGRLVVRSYCDQLAAKLRPEQLRHISASLGLHHRFWDVLQLSPPPASLRSKVARRLHYLALDDSLLRRWGKDSPATKLSPEELAIACEERGMDVLGKRDTLLQTQLDQWVKRQSADDMRGRALLRMLFRR